MFFFLVPTVPNRDIITWEFTNHGSWASGISMAGSWVNPQLRDGELGPIGEISTTGESLLGTVKNSKRGASSKGSQIQGLFPSLIWSFFSSLSGILLKSLKIFWTWLYYPILVIVCSISHYIIHWGYISSSSNLDRNVIHSVYIMPCWFCHSVIISPW